MKLSSEKWSEIAREAAGRFASQTNRRDWAQADESEKLMRYAGDQEYRLAALEQPGAERPSPRDEL